LPAVAAASRRSSRPRARARAASCCVGEPLERLARCRVALERRGQLGRNVELARRRVQLDPDLDLVAGRDARLLAHRRADREQELTPHPCHRRLIAVAAERHPDARPVAATERGDDLLRHPDPGRRLAIKLHHPLNCIPDPPLEVCGCATVSAYGRCSART
jgi:hypothetical protein